MKHTKPLAVSVLLATTLTATTALGQGIEVVRYLNQETNPSVVSIQRNWVQNFIEANPGYDVILESAPASMINTRIATYVQAGAPLDVVHADGGSAARAAAAGLLEPLDDVIERLGGREAFLPGRLLEHEGSVYSINQAAASPQLHYRKDLFEAAGLEPPTTWEELIEAARTLHTDDVAGIALPGGENRATTIFSGIFLWQNCGNYFNTDLEVTLDNPQTAEALQFYADLLEYSPPDAAAWAFNEPIESFWSGRAAMVPFWHGMDMILQQNPDMIDKVGVVNLPKGRMKVSEQGGRYVSLFKSSTAIDASKAWIEYIFSPDIAKDLTELQPMLYPPATDAALEALRSSEAPTFQAYGDALFDVVYASAPYAYNQIFHGGGIDAESCTMNNTGILNPFVSVVWNSNLYARAVQRVAYDNVDPATAAADVHAALIQQVDVARSEIAE